MLRKHSTGENYTFNLITDLNSSDGNLMQISNTTESKRLSYQWPNELYSLSHLAMPISQDDPLYGDKNAPKSPGIQLGYLAMYGESGVLQIQLPHYLDKDGTLFMRIQKKKYWNFWDCNTSYA